MPELLNKLDSIRLFSGKYLNLLNPDPADIFLIDIAVGLARECRWGNHTKKFYSVAEHSVDCMNLAENFHPGNVTLAIQCLLHDAHEAYLKDIPRPLKLLIHDYKTIADRVQKAICIRYGLDYPYSDYEKVSAIDNTMLSYEWEQKVKTWSGLEMNEKSRIDNFIHHMVRLCKHPIAIQP